MNHVYAPRHRQSGAFLLEALIAILIFTLGVLGIVGLQARSLKAVGEAQYRGEAAFYAETLAGRMWAHDPASVQTYFAQSGTGFTSWSDQITAAGTGLPGAAIKPPLIEYKTDVDSLTGVRAVVTIFWQLPGDERECGGDTSQISCYHKYVSSIVVGSNVST
jgi:type IV pilus assembly protein PilV